VRLAKAPVARALAFAPLLTLFEAARGTVFTGFPWAFPGHALIDTPWLAVSAFAGAHGLTLLVAGAGALWASMPDGPAPLARRRGGPGGSVPAIRPAFLARTRRRT
jgi:apolipoprotein N-acyltransferase